METEAKKAKKEETFVSYLIRRLGEDNSFGAMLRRADNPATEYQAWEHLVSWCDIENKRQRLPFAIISSALARVKPAKDGHLGIGQGIARCYEDGAKSDAAKARLRRLLACNTTEEACRILRPILSLIQSRGVPIKYSRLLEELLWFNETRKVRWAVDFYGRKEEYVRDDA